MKPKGKKFGHSSEHQILEDLAFLIFCNPKKFILFQSFDFVSRPGVGTLRKKRKLRYEILRYVTLRLTLNVRKT